jgi:hypothetical protein
LDVACTKATVVIDWDRGAPPTATLECILCGIDVPIEPENLTLAIQGKQYRLIEETDLDHEAVLV